MNGRARKPGPRVVAGDAEVPSIVVGRDIHGAGEGAPVSGDVGAHIRRVVGQRACTRDVSAEPAARRDLQRGGSGNGEICRERARVRACSGIEHAQRAAILRDGAAVERIGIGCGVAQGNDAGIQCRSFRPCVRSVQREGAGSVLLKASGAVDRAAGNGIVAGGVRDCDIPRRNSGSGHRAGRGRIVEQHGITGAEGVRIHAADGVGPERRGAVPCAAGAEPAQRGRRACHGEHYLSRRRGESEGLTAARGRRPCQVRRRARGCRAAGDELVCALAERGVGQVHGERVRPREREHAAGHHDFVIGAGRAPGKLERQRAAGHAQTGTDGERAGQQRGRAGRNLRAALHRDRAVDAALTTELCAARDRDRGRAERTIHREVAVADQRGAGVGARTSQDEIAITALRHRGGAAAVDDSAVERRVCVVFADDIGRAAGVAGRALQRGICDAAQPTERDAGDIRALADIRAGGSKVEGRRCAAAVILVDPNLPAAGEGHRARVAADVSGQIECARLRDGEWRAAGNGHDVRRAAAAAARDRRGAGRRDRIRRGIAADVECSALQPQRCGAEQAAGSHGERAFCQDDAAEGIAARVAHCEPAAAALRQVAGGTDAARAGEREVRGCIHLHAASEQTRGHADVGLPAARLREGNAVARRKRRRRAVVHAPPVCRCRVPHCARSPPHEFAGQGARRHDDADRLRPRMPLPIGHGEIKPRAAAETHRRRERGGTARHCHRAAGRVACGEDRRCQEPGREFRHVHRETRRRAADIPGHRAVRDRFEVQVFLQPSVARDRPRRHERRAGEHAAAAGEGGVVVLRGGIPAQRRLVVVRHAVAIGVRRSAGGIQRAESAAAHGQVALAGDAASRLCRYVLHEQCVHLVAQRTGVVHIKAQRTRGAHDFLPCHSGVINRQRRGTRRGDGRGELRIGR